MPIKRIFVDWTQPLLPEVSRWLLSRVPADEPDLSSMVVVVPGRRAGRRLEELLAEQSGDKCLPPAVITASQLPELLYEPQRPFASDLVQKLVWAEALRSLPRDELETVVRQPPEDGDLANWIVLGDLLRTQHRELAADQMNFADVARRGAQLPTFAEQQRWRVLARVQEDYLRRLDALELWDRQTARLVAIERHECATENPILLVGTVDLNDSIRAMLDQVSEHVTAVVHAPETWAPRFDAHGCLIAEQWAGVHIPLEESQVEIGDGPEDQAEAVALALADLGGRYRPDDVTIGAPDARLVPFLERRLSSVGVAAAWTVGRSLAEERPLRLLRLVADYLDQPEMEPLSRLVRHPDVFAWVSRKIRSKGWLRDLDAYRARHLQRGVTNWLGADPDKSKACRAVKAVRKLLDDFGRKGRPLGEWGEPIAKLLKSVYGRAQWSTASEEDRGPMAAFDAISEAFETFAEVPASLMPRMTASAAIRLILDEVGSQVTAPARNDEAIEIVGWLELPLDDAPVAVVTSYNEQFVPDSVNSDLFLPNALRRHLGVMDNDRRYARDAYATHVLLNSREVVRFIVGRMSPSQDPLTPSRLLFATTPAAVARRIVRFYGSDDSARPRRMVRSAAESLPAGPGYGPVPPPPSLLPLERMSVTSFRTYIACPYRFFLRHVLQLGSVVDRAEELDGAAFGNLIHAVLERFGHSDVSREMNLEVLEQYLNEQLDQMAGGWFGEAPLPAVRVQIEQARHRLRAFARWQANWAKQGWEIAVAEEEHSRWEVEFKTSHGQPIVLYGRIDRIDRNAETGEWIIFDYKTADAGTPPESTHRKRKSGEWIDLQLPLYRHLAAGNGIAADGEPVSLGYILLPKQEHATGDKIAPWTDEDLMSADELARAIGGRVLGGEFWPPAAEVDYDDYASLCLESDGFSTNGHRAGAEEDDS